MPLSIGNTCKLTVARGFLFSFLLCGNLILNFSTGVYSQTRSTRFQHLTIDDGLPQNMVDCMLQDSQGFLWFGTWNGLCRYDGYNFEIFDNENSAKNTFRDNFIYSMVEGPYGNIWIGTNRGLSTYLYDQDRFLVEGYKQPDGVSPISDVRALSLFNDSTLLVGTSTGLVIFNIKDKQGALEPVRQYDFMSIGGVLPGSIVNDVTGDLQQNIWVATNGGLVLLSPKGEEPIIYTFNSDPSISSNQVLSIYTSPEGEVWAGTDAGINRLDQNTFQFSQYFHDNTNPLSLVHNSVMDIIEDQSGRTIFATLGGISILNEGGQTFTNYKSEYNVEHSLTNDFVNCLLTDKSGNIWIGTERGGVSLYNIRQNVVEHYEYKANNPNSLSYSTINSVYEDQTYLWIGTAGGGLNRYHKDKGTFTYYRSQQSNPNSISSDFITTIARDKRDRLWVGTWGVGVNIMDDSGGFTQYNAIEYPGLVSSYISSTIEDDKGNIWLGTLGGVSMYNFETGQFEAKFQDAPTQTITNVGCLHFSDAHNLWLGTRNGLYHMYSDDTSFGQDTKITRYIHSRTDESSISGNYVISIRETKDGTLWFGTYGQGLNQLIQNGDSVSFKSYGTNEGLSNTVIYGIEEDGEGNLWLSTDYGLSRLNPDTDQVRNFFTTDGLLNNQYYWSASYKNKDGKLYFGGMRGLDAFYPAWIKDEPQTNEVVITDIRLLNESILPNKEYNGVEVLEKNIQQTERINLSYKEKVFGIEFSSLNYQEPDMIRYAYILEGLEKEWNYVSSTRRYASYTNLKPGLYTFKVKASGTDGNFDAPVTKISVYIAPPFWETGWFRSLCVLFIAALIFGYIRWRTYSLKRQKIILEQQVKERTERINKQKEALSYQAVQLQHNNQELEEKQKMIEGQNLTLESQNKEILDQHDELKKLNRKLKLVSQLKLSFFTNISHEFRTPLTLILGPIEKLMKEFSLNTEVKGTLQVMNRNAQRLLHLVNQIMDFRKIEQGRMELQVSKGSISGFCRNVFKAFEPLSDTRGIYFSFKEKDVPGEVWFDKQKMENILYNILSNAFKYTNQGGSVKLELSGLSFAESRLKINESLSSNEKPIISIKVSDTGIGISEENLPLVFKRFYRIESEEAFKIGGSGIGLALTEELIKTHHGEIFVSSKKGEGSTFEIQFPCLQNQYGADEITQNKSDEVNISQQVELLKGEFLAPEEENQEEQEVQIQITGREKPLILVVEDNNDLRNFIAHRLEKQYEVMEAVDGKIGIEKAVKHWPDLVISDVMMPQVGGFELCAHLKNNLATSHIPIILLTAKSAVENQIEGLQIGADEYLAKPFNFELLEARVSNLIAARTQLRKKFLETSDYTVNESTTNLKDEKFLEHAIRVVEGQMEDSQFGVKEFVEQMGISRSLLHKKLKKLTDQSAAEFINQLRMRRAKSLLKEGVLNVSEVAYAVGYNDPKYFTRLFNKHFGKSPKEFKIN